MKILIIAQKEFAYNNGRFVGGIQKVEYDQVKALVSQGDDVDIFVPSDTEEGTFSEFSGVNVRRSSKRSQDQLSAGDKAKITKHRNIEIRALLANNQYDCVIVHDWSISIHKLFRDQFKHVPALVYLHNTPVDSGGIQMFDRINTYTKLHQQGTISVTVSHTCKRLWIQEIHRKIESPGQSKFIEQGTKDYFAHSAEKIFDVLWPGLIEEAREPIEHMPGDRVFATMISRLNDNKRIDLASKICHEAGIELVLFCPSPRSQEQQAIVDSFLKFHPDENLMMDFPREDMFDIMRRSALHVIPSVESFSLVAIEANACGIPCLIVDRGYLNSPHEATQANDVYNVAWDSRAKRADRDHVVRAAVQRLPLPFPTRQKIARTTAEFYDIEMVGARLKKKIVEAIERKKAYNTETPIDDGIFTFG